MPSQMIKQPNGRYALFSSIVDDFTATGKTREGMIDFRLRTERRDPKITSAHLDLLDRDGAYLPEGDTLTWQDALELIRLVHGKAHLNKVLAEMESEADADH